MPLAWPPSRLPPTQPVVSRPGDGDGNNGDDDGEGDNGGDDDNGGAGVDGDSAIISGDGVTTSK